jgi:hypothetical protein
MASSALHRAGQLRRAVRNRRPALKTGLNRDVVGKRLMSMSSHYVRHRQGLLFAGKTVPKLGGPTANAQRFYSPAAEEQRDLTAPVAPAGSWAGGPEADA